MCINSVKETCFSQKYQKWIYQVLEMSSSIIEHLVTLALSSLYPVDLNKLL